MGGGREKAEILGQRNETFFLCLFTSALFFHSLAPLISTLFALSPSPLPLHDFSLLHQGTIDARHDVLGGRLSTDRVAAKTTDSSKQFTSLCYSADGSFLLAGGSTKFGEDR